MITLIPEGVLYGMQLVKAHDFCFYYSRVSRKKQVVFSTRMKEKNVNLIPDIEKKMKEQNMDGWKYEYTKGRVDHNQPLNFKIKSRTSLLYFLK